jgi:hypothetical protein
MKPEENAPIKVEPRVFPEEHAVPYASTTPVRIKEDPVKQENINPAPIKETPEAISLRRQTNFRSKNNSKLRRILADCNMSTSGRRDELVTRLEANPTIDYEQYNSDQLP